VGVTYLLTGFSILLACYTLLSAAGRYGRPAADSRVGILFQKALYTVKVLLKMGGTVVRNM